MIRNYDFFASADLLRVTAQLHLRFFMLMVNIEFAPLGRKVVSIAEYRTGRAERLHEALHQTTRGHGI
jgi:hypothetical protein